MQAIHVTEANSMQMTNRPKPSPKNGEALVRLKYAGINYIDIYMRTGNPVIPVPFPFIPGLEGSGIVEEIGNDVTEVQCGDRVAFIGVLGAYAEYISVPASKLIPLPDDISFEQGATFPLQGMTAQYLSNDIYPVSPSDTVLVHAAAGGVGLLVVQWLKTLGARVIGTVSTEEKAQVAKIAGCDEVIIYTAQDFVTETMRLTHGRGVDYIIDGVGKSTLAQDLEAIRPRGYVCYFGLASGLPDPVDVHKLQLKSVVLCGGNLMDYITTREELIMRSQIVINALREGWLNLHINHIFPLNEAHQAHHMLESRQSTGKLLIKIGE